MEHELGVSEPDSDARYLVQAIKTSAYTWAIAGRSRAGSLARAQDVVDAMLLDLAIVAWDGVNWNRRPAPCTTAMKAMLPPAVRRGLLKRAFRLSLEPHMSPIYGPLWLFERA